MKKRRFGLRRNWHGVDANVVGRELERVWEAGGEKLLPSAVLDAARPATAPLHPVFEWDDKLAAEAHRIRQARELIRDVYVIEPSGYQQPVFHHVTIERPAEPARYYQHVDILPKRPGEFLAALEEARRYLDEAERRFTALENLSKAAGSADDGELGKITAIIAALRTAKTVASHLQ